MHYSSKKLHKSLKEIDREIVTDFVKQNRIITRTNTRRAIQHQNRGWSICLFVEQDEQRNKRGERGEITEEEQNWKTLPECVWERHGVYGQIWWIGEWVSEAEESDVRWVINVREFFYTNQNYFSGFSFGLFLYLSRQHFLNLISDPQ